jgi:hypothetical protein
MAKVQLIVYAILLPEELSAPQEVIVDDQAGVSARSKSVDRKRRSGFVLRAQHPERKEAADAFFLGRVS